MAKKQSGGGKSGLLVVILAIAVILLGGMWYLSQPSETSTSTSMTTGSVEQGAGTGATGTGATGTAVAPAAPAAASQQNVGEIDIALKDMQGNNGGTSNMLLLNPKYAKYDATTGAFMPDATRYAIMNIHYNQGLDGLTSITGGSPRVITASSGTWTESSLQGKIGDKVLVYTYVNTSPVATQNESTAHVITLKDFYRETGKWVFATDDGLVSWNLYDYANYNWFTGTDTAAVNYTIADNGVTAANQIIDWYSRAGMKGELCADCSIYLKAPSNFTGKFHSLSLNDKQGHSVKFTSLSPANNFNDYRQRAATVLASATAGSAGGDSTYTWYYVGDIPDSFVTLYTAGDKNRLTWEMSTDTYGSNMTVVYTVVQNAGAEVTSNGPFQIAATFPIRFSNGATSEFNDPSVTLS